MNISIYSYYDITLSDTCDNFGGIEYGNYLYYPMARLYQKLRENGYKLQCDNNKDIDIAVFFDLDEKLFQIACSLPKRIKKILVCIESPIYCPFAHHVDIMFHDLWYKILTYNRSFISNKIIYYDIAVAGNITNSLFVPGNKNKTGVIVSSYKNDLRGYIPIRRDRLLKKLAGKNEIEIFGKNWKVEKNILGSTKDKIKSMQDIPLRLQLKIQCILDM
jgi:hypothetical protein